MRRTIANRLRESVDTAVHFTVMDEADVSELDVLRKKLAAASGEKVSFLPFVCSAVARALSEQYGVLNATVDDANEEIIQHRSVHLGIATDTESGLMVPVIRDADRMGVLEIGRHIGRDRGRGPEPEHPPRSAHGFDVHDHQCRQLRRAVRDARDQLPRGGHPGGGARPRGDGRRQGRLVPRGQAAAAEPRVRSPCRRWRDRGVVPGEGCRAAAGAGAALGAGACLKQTLPATR
ncbi:MAG: hypothetical protein HND58_08770 [Planctomycetota bacterium]|nr:MAG: hypothetical protein HND58_08770 [Planctomycetota bacterium]